MRNPLGGRGVLLYGGDGGVDGGGSGDGHSAGFCQSSNPSLTARRASAMTSFTERPFVDIDGCMRSRTSRG